ncbi:MAG: hypothetical protein KatS3mg032_0993 [Cyclobacteriaceae bacterium]|nr:MAG: hypothetical protein KatS3mg032_0993 [Cyclobacteriaceae bacterium]
MKKSKFSRLILLAIGMVVSASVICLEVLQYHKPEQTARQEESNTPEKDRPADEILSMPACAQSTAPAHESSSALHVILELFADKPADEPIAAAESRVWNFILEKILQAVISPNAP